MPLITKLRTLYASSKCSYIAVSVFKHNMKGIQGMTGMYVFYQQSKTRTIAKNNSSKSTINFSNVETEYEKLYKQRLAHVWMPLVPRISIFRSSSSFSFNHHGRWCCVCMRLLPVMRWCRGWQWWGVWWADEERRANKSSRQAELITSRTKCYLLISRLGAFLAFSQFDTKFRIHFIFDYRTVYLLVTLVMLVFLIQFSSYTNVKFIRGRRYFDINK